MYLRGISSDLSLSMHRLVLARCFGCLQRRCLRFSGCCHSLHLHSAFATVGQLPRSPGPWDARGEMARAGPAATVGWWVAAGGEPRGCPPSALSPGSCRQAIPGCFPHWCSLVLQHHLQPSAGMLQCHQHSPATTRRGSTPEPGLWLGGHLQPSGLSATGDGGLEENQPQQTPKPGAHPS